MSTAGAFQVNAGDVLLAHRGQRLEVLLGSCVSVVMTDPRRTIGVMCHIVHVGLSSGGATRTAVHADVAIKAMHSLLVRHGITPQLCEAFVYGGGNMFPAIIPNSHIGETNYTWVLDALCCQGIRVRQCDVGGATYRRIGWTVGDASPEVTSVAV